MTGTANMLQEKADLVINVRWLSQLAEFGVADLMVRLRLMDL